MIRGHTLYSFRYQVPFCRKGHLFWVHSSCVRVCRRNCACPWHFDDFVQRDCLTCSFPRIRCPSSTHFARTLLSRCQIQVFWLILTTQCNYLSLCCFQTKWNLLNHRYTSAIKWRRISKLKKTIKLKKSRKKSYLESNHLSWFQGCCCCSGIHFNNWMKRRR